MNRDTANLRLKEAAKKKGIATAVALAERFNIPVPTARSYLNGHRKLTPEISRVFSRGLGCSWSWLYDGADGRQPRPPIKLAITGVIGAGQSVVPQDDPLGQLDLANLLEGAEAFEVVGDSMLPVARPGDIVLFGEPMPVEMLIGRECVVDLVDGRRFFKIIERSGTLFNLHSYYMREVIRDVEIVRAGPLLTIVRS